MKTDLLDSDDGTPKVGTDTSPVDLVEEDEIAIEKDQLKEYQEMVEDLGSFPVSVWKS